MTSIDRRALLRRGAAVLATAAVVPVTAQANGDDALMGLWQRFIAAEVLFAGAAVAEDEASFAARREAKSLPPVYRYCGPPNGCVYWGFTHHQERNMRRALAQ
jgi:hypothetical protein